jgi:hypothetical protein
MITQKIEGAKLALERIIQGLTSERNACWATKKPWTKKERDEAILSLARGALADLRAVDETISLADLDRQLEEFP